MTAYTPPPPEWPTTSDPPVPLSDFGKDHWSTFAYVECRAVDHRGRLEHDHMRCHEGRHPLFVNAGRRARVVGGATGSAWPTILRDGTRPDHDDYDCLDDLRAAGLLTVTMPTPSADGLTFAGVWGETIPVDTRFVTGMDEALLAVEARWSLTERGARVASELRVHKAGGGNFASFRPSPEALA